MTPTQSAPQDWHNLQTRIAEQADFFEILRICKMLHAENGQHSLSEQKLRALIWRAIIKDHAIMAVIGPSDDIRAMIMLEISPIYYSDESQVYELWSYVRPDSRKSDFAKRLIGFAKDVADEMHLDLTIGIISEDRLEAKARLYARLLPKGGQFFIYRGGREAANAQAAE